jgi:Lipopolysaccharide export system permease LptF/LptG
MIPGRALHRLSAGICCAKTLEHVVEPAIADLQKEYAIAPSRMHRVRVLVTGYAAIIKVVGICALRPSEPTGEDRHALGRILMWSVGSVVATTALLLVPPLLNRNQSISSWFAAATLIPQAVPLGIPIGIVFGVALGLSTRPNMNVAKVTLFGALAASALSLATLAWAMPAANQAFNQIAIDESRARGYDGPVQLQKSYNEMWLSELRRQAELLAADGEPRLARLFVFRFHFRLSFAAATFSLVSLLIAASVGHRGLRFVTALAACLAYWMLMYAGDAGSRGGYLAPSLGAWLPNLVFVVSAIFFASSYLRGSSVRGSMSPAR